MTNDLDDFCPRGFVIPDDIGRSTNIFINKTISLCAVSCMHTPALTDQQESIVEAVNISATLLTSLFALAVALVWRCDFVKRKQAFIMANGFVMGGGFMIIAIFLLLGPARLCQDNTTAVMGGPISVCAVEGALITYIFMFTVLCYCCQSFEVFRRVVLGHKKPPNMRMYILFLFGLPMFVVVFALATGSFGHLPNYPMCGMISRSGWSFILTIIPVVFATVGGFLFTTAVIIKLIWLIRQPDGISATSGAYLTGSTAMYLLFSTGYFWSLLFIGQFGADMVRNRDERMVEWGSCVLENYDGSTSTSYTGVCGVQPELPLPFVTICVLFMWARVGFGLFFFLVNIEGLYGIARRYLHETRILPLNYEEQRADAISTSSVEGVTAAPANTATTAAASAAAVSIKMNTINVSSLLLGSPPKTQSPPRTVLNNNNSAPRIVPGSGSGSGSGSVIIVPIVASVLPDGIGSLSGSGGMIPILTPPPAPGAVPPSVGSGSVSNSVVSDKPAVPAVIAHEVTNL